MNKDTIPINRIMYAGPAWCGYTFCADDRAKIDRFLSKLLRAGFMWQMMKQMSTRWLAPQR